MSLPRWSADFNVNEFDLRAVYSEAAAQKKSAYDVLRDAGYPVFKFVSDGAVEVTNFHVGETASKAAAEGDPGIVTLVASTNAIDLVGDVMEQSALEQMKQSAPGTSVFLNHSYNLPEDLFGTVIEAEIVTKNLINPLAKEAQPYLCLIYKVAPVTKDENPRGFQTYTMLSKGKRKLGASVTVLVLEKAENPDGKRSIKKVFYIETSMVGVPCNQLSWAQYAAQVVADEGKKPTENPARANGAGLSAKSFGVKVMPEIASNQPQVASKGLYVDKVKSKVQKFWFMVSALEDVIYDLKSSARRKVAMDYGAELGTALDEFKTAVTDAVLPVLEAMPSDNDGMSYYSLFDPQTGASVFNHITSKMMADMSDEVRKAGARNSKADMEMIQAMHDTCCSLGAKCMSDDKSKGVSEAAAGVETSMGELVSKSDLDAVQASLTEKEAEIAILQKQIADLEVANKSISDERDKWKLGSFALGAKVNEMAEMPLPRIGQSV